MGQTLLNRLSAEFELKDDAIDLDNAALPRLLSLLFEHLETEVVETLPVSVGELPDGMPMGTTASSRPRHRRTYLLPTRHLRPRLSDRLASDRARGLQADACNVNGLVQELAAHAPGSFAFSLWDAQVLVAPNGDGWRASGRTEDIARAQRFLDLLQRAAPAHAQTDEKFEEPLFLSTAAGLEFADQLCRRDGEDACYRYHGIRPVLRLFDLVMAPGEQGDLLEAALGTLARTGRRVLISACADYSILAHLWHAYDRAGESCEVTIIDRCETPLRLCQWYADFRDRPVTVRQSRLETYTAETPFDVILSHGFLSGFNPSQRNLVIEKWHSLLRKGGTVVSVGKLRPNAVAGTVRRTPEHVRAFAQRTVDQARAWRDFLPLDEDWLRARAEDYVAEKRQYPIATRDDFLAMFEQAGFDARDAGSVSIAGRDYDLPPEQSGSADFIVCVATKR